MRVVRAVDVPETDFFGLVSPDDNYMVCKRNSFLEEEEEEMCQRLLQIFCFHIPQKWIDLSKPLRKQLPGSLAAIYTSPLRTYSSYPVMY